MTKSLLKKFGRRIRVGFIGGGIDSIIGSTHLSALRLDGKYELVAGVMSVNKKISKISAFEQLIKNNRIYSNYKEMAEKESELKNKIDVVVILTPPNLHAKIAIFFLNKGFNVICEKPASMDLNESFKIKENIKKNKKLFLLNHCYTAYPLVREARQLIRRGKLGKIILIESELCAGIPNNPKDKNNKTGDHFRFSKKMGEEILLAEVGSHPFSLVSFITDLKIKKLSAHLQILTKGRQVYDNGYITSVYSNGAVGRTWVSYVAQGNDHGLSFRIYGEKGGLIWNQEDPNSLFFKQNNLPVKIYKPAHNSLDKLSQFSSRLRPGHPEGLLSAFANLYSEFAEVFFSKELNQRKYPNYSDILPGIDNGIEINKIIKSSIKSNKNFGKWIDTLL